MKMLFHRQLFFTPVLCVITLCALSLNAIPSLADSIEEACAFSAYQFPPKLVDGEYPHHYRPDRTIDAKHLLIDMKVIMQEMAVEGTAAYQFVPLHDNVTRIRLDALAMDIRDVKCDSTIGFDWSYSDNELYITFEKPLPIKQTELSVSYYATMKHREFSGLGSGDGGMFFADTESRVPPVYNQMHTLNEPFGAASWFPCVDYPNDQMVTEMKVAVPKQFKTLSNGLLVDSKTNGGWRTDHWKQERPHTVYLVSIVVGEFEIVRDEWRGIPVEYYVEPSKAKDARPSLGATVDMLEFFSNYLDFPYPYEKYAQVHVREFRAGGMEHTTATTLHEWSIIDEEARLDHDTIGLVAHELAHQWFGDAVTCEHWGHLWLNESFATFFDALWTEQSEGEAAYLHQLWGNMHSYFGEANRYTRSIVTNTFANPSEMFDSHSYPKGAVVLHMLRNELGDELFRKSLNRYLVDNAPNVVDTADLLDAIEKATGRPMDRFFEQWIYGPGHPKVTIKHEWLSNHNQLKLSLEQTQKQDEGKPAFAFPLLVRVHTKSGSFDQTVAISKMKETIFLDCDEQPLGIEIDPYLHVMMDLTFNKSAKMSLYEVQHGSTVISRLRAGKELGGNKTGEVVEAAGKAIWDEPFWALKADAAASLGEIGTDEALETLLKAVEHPHPKVRYAVVSALGKFHGKPEAIRVLQDRFKNDESIRVIARAARALARLEAPDAYSTLKSALGRNTHRNTIHFAVVDSLVDLKEARIFSSLKKFSGEGNSIGIRSNALRNIGRLAKETEKNHSASLKILLSALKSPSEQLRRAAAQGLGSLEEEDAIDELRKIAQDDLDPKTRTAAQDAINNIRKSGGALGTENAKRLDDLEPKLDKLLDRIDELETLLKKAAAKDDDDEGPGDGDKEKDE